MKIVNFLILFLCFGLFCFAQDAVSTELNAVERDDSAWKEFASVEGGFSVKFPGTPKRSTETIDLPNAEIKMQIFSLRTFAEYSVMYADYPIQQSENPEAAKKMLDNGARGAVASAGSELLEFKEISIGKFPGRFLKEKMPRGEIMWVRMYLVGRRMFQVAITTPKEDAATRASIAFYEKTAYKFLDSFKLYVPPSAPLDKPILGTRADELKKLEEAIKPYIQKAKETYPEAKKRFLKGLPAKHTFFITTRLRDEQGRLEQVFIAVKEIKDGIVKGIIWSDIAVVSGYRRGEGYSFPESELVDWTIIKPDGSEEGNFVGKFLDTYRP